MKRRFSVNLWLWYPDASYENYSAIYKAQDAGFDGRLDLPTLRGLLSTTGLTPIIIGGGSEGTDISSEDEAVRKNGLEYIRRCIDACYTLGGELVCGPLYGCVGKTKFLQGEQRAETLRRIAGTLAEAADYAS